MSEKLCPGCPGDPNETCCKPELRVQRWREQQGSALTCDQQRADRKAINDAINVLEVLLDLNSEATPPRMLRRLGPMWWWRVRDIMHALLERSGRDLAWFYKERQAKPAPGEVLVYAYWPDGSRKLLEFATWPHRTDLPSDAVRFDIAWPDGSSRQERAQPAGQAGGLLHSFVDSAAQAGITHMQIEDSRIVLGKAGKAPSIEAARELGAKGGPVVEAERLAFESWMAGHCWQVSPTWNGREYEDSAEDKKRKLLDPLARMTRMLWAAWRDRAALNACAEPTQPARQAGGEVSGDVMTRKWCWWLADSESFHIEDTESGAHGEAQGHIDSNCEPGHERKYSVARVQHPIDSLGIDWLARNVAEHIEDNVCRWCDDNTGAEEPSIALSKEDQNALGLMVAGFLREKASVDWWTYDKTTITEHTYVSGSNDSQASLTAAQANAQEDAT